LDKRPSRLPCCVRLRPSCCRFRVDRPAPVNL
jgi:hypothetical protein